MCHPFFSAVPFPWTTSYYFIQRPVCIKSFGLYTFSKRPLGHVSFWSFVLDKPPVEGPFPPSEVHLHWSAFKRKRAALAAKQSGHNQKNVGENGRVSGCKKTKRLKNLKHKNCGRGNINSSRRVHRKINYVKL